MMPRKPPDRRQRGGRTPDLRILPGGRKSIDPPAAPRGLLKATRDQWAAFWTSDAAQFVDQGSDAPALERLFVLYDERRRAHVAYAKERIVKGSKGQPVRNPLAHVISECDAGIRVLEDRFGLTPKARLQLGLPPGGGLPSIDDLNRSLNVDPDDGDSDQDPRAQTA